MTSAVMTIDRALKQVDEAVEKVLNDKEQRFPEAASVGDAVRQGDIYIQKIDPVTATPKLYKKLERVNYPLQLAPGDTKGSRHMLEADETATVYALLLDIQAAETGDKAEDADERFKQQIISRDKFRIELQEHARSFTNEGDGESRQWESKTNLVSQEISAVASFCGPIFNLTKEAKITHPEHGDWVLPPGSYRITFQRTIDSDMRIQRVLD